MLRKPPTNLNKQSQDATIHLIRSILSSGITLSEIYVDALGSTDKYQSYLSSLFPGIEFTVTQKADSKFKIVGAASVAAKVTRDACIEGWYFEEDAYVQSTEEDGEPKKSKWSTQMGSGYPSDPNTVKWLKGAVDPVFGFPKIVRFSWTTVKTLLDKEAHGVKWCVS
jgi:ribonuclease H2 subunit A